MSKKFTPLSGTNVSALVPQMNRALATLDKEVDTKTYGGRNGTDGLTIGRTGTDTTGLVVMQNNKKTLEIGIYQDGRNGLIIYDENEVPIGLFGQAPNDGRVGLWIASSGVNVLELLGG